MNNQLKNIIFLNKNEKYVNTNQNELNCALNRKINTNNKNLPLICNPF